MTNEATKSLSWDSFERNYWKYYLKLEKEFIEVIDYIEFVPENYPTYSVKLMQSPPNFCLNAAIAVSERSNSILMICRSSMLITPLRIILKTL